MGINLAVKNNWYYQKYAFASFRYGADGTPNPLVAYKYPTWIRMLIERCSRNKYRCPMEVRGLIERWAKKKGQDPEFITRNGFRGYYEDYLKFGIIIEKTEFGWQMGSDEWTNTFELRGCRVCSITHLKNAKIEFINNNGSCAICERSFYSDNLKGSFISVQTHSFNRG